MENNEFDFDIISVTDDDGNEHQFEEIDRIETDDGNRYVALLPILEDADEYLESDGDVIVLKVLENDGETYLIEIESEEEFSEIRGIFEERINEMFDQE